MQEQTTTLQRNCSLGCHHVIWNGKTKHTSWKGSFSGTCLFSPLGLKEFYLDLNRSFDSKSAPIRLFVRYARFSVRVLEPGNLNENYLMKCLLIVNVLFCFFFFLVGAIKFNVQQDETFENFKTVWTYLTSQESALTFMRIFCFQKPLFVTG